MAVKEIWRLRLSSEFVNKQKIRKLLVGVESVQFGDFIMVKGTPRKTVGAKRTCRKSTLRPRDRVPSHASSSSSQASPESDYSEAVEIVHRIHDEKRKAQAVRILEANIDDSIKFVKESLQGYRDAILDQSSHATCKATTAHRRIEAANLVLHRNVSTLNHIRQQPASTYSFTLFDMPAKGRYRRVSIDGEVSLERIFTVPIFSNPLTVFVISSRPTMNSPIWIRWVMEVCTRC